ncbi:heterokaryon incompatibility protein-domain-containing protein [Dichomitus squalens]|nr:heterokaryon incompatibility protein-domain-containing protein [Dichomitus squalens]
MRLLNTETGQFEERDPESTKYAILSHTWDAVEQTYEEVRELQRPYASNGVLRSSLAPHNRSLSNPERELRPLWDNPELSAKVRDACTAAREAGYRYIWIDSCCIDKTSSSELSEAINSMYKWYALSAACYAYLADVPFDEDHRASRSSFRRSRWFERGWTLQELIAPLEVIFLSQDWKVIGSKHTLVDLVWDVTGIPEEALLHMESLDAFSVAQRLSWAASRQTTREEDHAYSLLGIFDINMPTLYGEGKRAFRRLQEEIVRRVPDQSLFAWWAIFTGIEARQDLVMTATLQNAARIAFNVWDGASTSFLATDVTLFAAGGSIRAVSHDDVFHRLQLSHLPATEYTSTPHGIRTQIPVIPLSFCVPQHAAHYPEKYASSQWYLAILGCEHEDYPGHLLGRVCYIPPSESGVEHLYCGYAAIDPTPERGTDVPELFPLSPDTLSRCRPEIQLKTIYISHPERAIAGSLGATTEPHRQIELTVSSRARHTLLAQGYSVELSGPALDSPAARWLTLSKDNDRVMFAFLHALDNVGRKLTITARVTMSQEPSSSSTREIHGTPISVSWSDYAPWSRSLGARKVTISDPSTSQQLTVALTVSFAGLSYYLLHVAVATETPVAVAALIVPP